MRSKTFFIVFFCATLLNCKAQMKLISYPQQGPDTRLLKNNYRLWENTLPFNGLCISFNANEVNNNSSTGYYGNWKGALSSSVFKKNINLRYADYTHAINDLKVCNFKSFKNNFIILPLFEVNWSPWEDDKSWLIMINNLKVACRIAFKSGLKGVVLDTETYGSPQNLNLLFYCEQFIDYTLKKGNTTAYCKIDKGIDAGKLDDLFPKKNRIVYWKNNEGYIGNLRLERVYLNIYKDKNNNYYYPLLDIKYYKQVENIIEKVKERGRKIILAINEEFPKAEIILTCGPSYVKNVLQNNYGLNDTNNYLRTGYGLIVPLVKGMLEELPNKKMKLIDGQEQTYYHKKDKDFNNALKSFNQASVYFGKDSLLYQQFMNKAIGLYMRPASDKNNSNPRLFSWSDLNATLKYVKAQPNIEYLWFYEENESYWYLEELKSRYLNSSNMSRIGGSDNTNYLKIIRTNLNLAN